MPVFYNVRKLIFGQEKKRSENNEQGSSPKKEAEEKSILDLSEVTAHTSSFEDSFSSRPPSQEEDVIVEEEEVEDVEEEEEDHHLWQDISEQKGEAEEENLNQSQDVNEEEEEEGEDKVDKEEGDSSVHPTNHHQQQQHHHQEEEEQKQQQLETETERCLRIAIKNLRKHLKRTSEAMELKNMESEELEQMVADLEKQLSYKCLEMDQVVQMMTSQLDEKDQEAKVLRASIEALTEQLKSKSEELEFIQEEYLTLDHAVWELEEQLERMKERICKKDSIIHQMALQRTAQAKADGLENALLNTIEQKEITILTLTQQLQDARLQTANDNNDHLEEEHALKMQLQIDELEGLKKGQHLLELDLESSKLLAEDHKRISSQLQVEFLDLTKQLTEKNKQADQHQRDIVELKKRHAEEVACKDAVISQMAKHLQTFQNELNELKTGSSSSSPASTDVLDDDVQTKLQGVTKEKEELAVELDSLKQKFYELQEVSTSKLQAMTSEKEDLEQQLESVRSSEAYLLNDNEAMMDVLMALQVELKETKEHAEHLQVKCDEQRRATRDVQRRERLSRRAPASSGSVCSNSSNTATSTYSTTASLSINKEKRQKKLQQYLSKQSKLYTF